MTQSLKQQTISGIIWSGVQRFGTVALNFVSNVVLARLLRPDDFGYIGMLMVFIAISDSFVNGGFDSALLQKKKPTDTDYSTIFHFNLLFSFILYLLLFIFAPTISSFYKLGQLALMLRVMGIITIINALALVQNNQLQKKLYFNKLAIINLASIAIGTIAGIILALLGFGVWSLIIKTILNAVSRSFLCWALSKWKPILVFSFTSFKELFSFGGLIFLSDITETIVNQLVSLIIGKTYSSEKLGYYTQANNLQRIPETTIPFVISQVFFPVFSSIQDNIDKVVGALKKSIKALAFVNFPLMVVLMVIAKPLILILFTEKWLESVPYFQILCLGGMLYSLNSGNVTVLKALGQGKSILYISIVKRLISLVFIIIGTKFGIYGIILGSVLSIYVWLPINAYYIGKLTGYSFSRQTRDIAPTFIISILVGSIIFFSFSFIGVVNNFLLIALQLISYSILYIGSAYLIDNESLKIYLGIALDTLSRLKKQNEHY